MIIEFFWNGGIVGTNHSMIIDGKEIFLSGVVSTKKEAADEAIIVLKEQYGIDYDPTNIVWKWGGRL